MIQTAFKATFAMAIFALLLNPVPDLRGDFTASGTFQYQDRELNRQGFTGDEPYLPIRLADVEVLDNVSSAILATGTTDTDGAFSIAVTDNVTRDVVVRVLTDTQYVNSSNRITQEWSGGWSGQPYALESAVFSSHNPNTDIDIGTVMAPENGPGKPFNIFDVQLNEMVWLQTLLGGNPNGYDLFRARWKEGANNGQAYYDGFGISIGGELPYDDTVIGHEGGHFINHHWSNDDNPGGTHYLGDNNQDPRLSYGEGVATWYASSSREYLGVNPAPHLYINTTGGEGQGNLSFSYDLEGPSVASYGPASELTVQAVIWDITDGTDTQDDSPGTDDDPLNLPYADVFEVFTDYLTLSLAAPRTIEDFWDGWFYPSIDNGHESDMITTFLDFQIEYYEDTLEPDNDMGQATTMNFLDDPVHHTGYGEDDEDWHKLDIVENASFRVRTTNRIPASYPVVTVFDSDGVTEIGNNSSDINQAVSFDGAGPGPYYARILQDSGFGIYTDYGHFDFEFDVTSAPPESAEIHVAPTFLMQSLPVGATGTDTTIIYNTGGGPLTYAISDKDRFSGDPADLPWLTEDPSTGDVGVGDSAIITVTFNTTGLTPDSSYDALIIVESNDIVNPAEEIIVRLTTGEAGIGNSGGSSSSGSLPKAFSMAQNYPNPFNPSTSIAYDVPEGQEAGVDVSLEVFNIRGQKIATLVSGARTPGSYVVQWDGKDDAGRTTGSGIYIYRIKAGDFTSTRKMVILK